MVGLWCERIRFPPVALPPIRGLRQSNRGENRPVPLKWGVAPPTSRHKPKPKWPPARGERGTPSFFSIRERSQRPHRLRADTRGDTRAFLKKMFCSRGWSCRAYGPSGRLAHEKSWRGGNGTFFILWATCSRREMPLFGVRYFGRALRGCESAAVRIRRRSQFSARSKVIASVLEDV